MSQRMCEIGLYAPLCENMASSTKPEVHNVLHCCQERIEPRRRVKCTENFVKFDVWFCNHVRYANRQTDRHTNTLTTAILRTLPGRSDESEAPTRSLSLYLPDCVHCKLDDRCDSFRREKPSRCADTGIHARKVPYLSTHF